uniref:Cytochrome b n=1 Tax=Taphrina wiesneri JCM 22204 TaxID=1450757 RepID=A0A2Z5RE32_9ASCO|nr:cytochrome b [Taphrina wiesneri JCM 22204]
MKLIKRHPLFSLLNSYPKYRSAQPVNISYLWNFGSLLGVCLVIQIITGITLAMHYTPSIDAAFISVEHIMRDVNYGWLIRYLHANTASFFFLFVYAHMARGLYYGSYRSPRVLVWSIGVVIFLVMIITAFLGYVLPYGQMSLWGATVITNLMSAIPWIGQDIVESVSNATLNRFFSLHYLLPFVLAALIIMHMIALHESGSNNPVGVTGNLDRLAMHPYFIFKDLVTIVAFFLVLSLFVFYAPNVLGHSDNYIPANPMQTPASIVPEWYLLPFYAILRSIPNKLLGVLAMIAAILVLFLMPIVDLSRLRGNAFKPFSKIAFAVFAVNFLLLMWLGSQHVESPYVEIGQICTAYYFAHFLIIIPTVSVFENTLMDVALAENLNLKATTKNDLNLNPSTNTLKKGNFKWVRAYSNKPLNTGKFKIEYYLTKIKEFVIGFSIW